MVSLWRSSAYLCFAKKWWREKSRHYILPQENKWDLRIGITGLKIPAGRGNYIGRRLDSSVKKIQFREQTAGQGTEENINP